MNPWKSRGFTLLELVILMVNLGIIMAIAVPAFMNWAPRYSLLAAARELRGNIQMCKLRAIMNNNLCVIQFNSPNLYTVAGESKLVPASGGGGFGKPPFGPVPHGAKPDDTGVTFPGKTAVFSPVGRPWAGGSVYLRNDQGQAFAVTVNLIGQVRLRKWQDGHWQEF